MTSFFPDLNVWLALSVNSHSHSTAAWNWFTLLPREAKLIFSRYTQLGLLRLLSNEAVMVEKTLTLRKACEVYDRWLQDPRIEFYPEPHGLDAALRHAIEPFASRKATKWVGDCYLLAYARQSDATLVTFDLGLHSHARKQGHAAVIPS